MGWPDNPPVLCLVGPTGTGKSAVALQAAERVGAEIVNCDSRQVYADFPGITAQPSIQDRARYVHHLYGFLPTSRSISAGRFADLAREVIKDIQARGRLPILVGGTGLYLRAIIYGLAPIPDISEPIRSRIARECDQHGPEVLHARLRTLDPKSANRLHPRDRQRITRALEVRAATGYSLSWWLQTYPCDQPIYRTLRLGLWSDLEALTPGLEARIDRMCELGAMQEVDQAWQRCPDEKAPGWSGIGCFELLQVLLGRWSMDQAKKRWLHNTRAYAKRQLTWFQKDPDIVWMDQENAASSWDVVASWLKDLEDRGWTLQNGGG